MLHSVSRSWFLPFLSVFPFLATSAPARGGTRALIIRDVVQPGAPVPVGDAVLCTGLNLTGACLVSPGNDPTCHDLSGPDAAFANAIKSILIPPGPESACIFFRLNNCTFQPDVTGLFGQIGLIAGDPGENEPFNDLSQLRFADVINSYHCAFVP